MRGRAFDCGTLSIDGVEFPVEGISDRTSRVDGSPSEAAISFTVECDADTMFSWLTRNAAKSAAIARLTRRARQLDTDAANSRCVAVAGHKRWEAAMCRAKHRKLFFAACGGGA